MTILELADALERSNPTLQGKLTRQIPELAGFRVHFRRRFYRLADFFFASCIFHAIVAIWSPFALLATMHRVAFAASFGMMFFCEFRARMLTRQLNRRASEQFALDLMLSRKD